VQKINMVNVHRTNFNSIHLLIKKKHVYNFQVSTMDHHTIGLVVVRVSVGLDHYPYHLK
jgi:hypothetical protein